jgi:hypothetical protein
MKTVLNVGVDRLQSPAQWSEVCIANASNSKPPAELTLRPAPSLLFRKTILTQFSTDLFYCAI